MQKYEDQSTAHHLLNLSSEMQNQRLAIEKLLRSTEAMTTKTSPDPQWCNKWPQTQGEQTATPPLSRQSAKKTTEDADN